jgi:hypothetical protein
MVPLRMLMLRMSVVDQDGDSSDDEERGRKLEECGVGSMSALALALRKRRSVATVVVVVAAASAEEETTSTVDGGAS